MKKAFLDIAKAVQIPGWQDSKINVFQLVQDWLEDEESGRWLLVLDNADDGHFLYKSEDSHLTHYFSKSDRRSTLMTTRYRKIAVSLAPNMVMPLSGLPVTDFVAILLSKSNSSTLDNSHRGKYEELADQLEHTPLALVQAAAFMAMNEVSVAEFLRLYHGSGALKKQLLSEDFEDETRDINTKNPAGTTWTIKFDRLRSQGLFAAELSSLMCILDTQAIPESLLLTNSHFSLKTALGTLRSLSLINL